MKKFLVASLFLVACGDNLARTNDATVSIDTPSSTIDAAPAIPKAVAVGGDFSTKGEISALNTSTLAVSQNLVAAAATDDPQLRHIDGKLYIVNRDTNNITVLDDTTYALVGQMATGAGSDPQDVAVVGSKLYVPAYLGKGVAIGTVGGTATMLDLTGAGAVNSIDMTPNCVGAYPVGTDVYVVCENLDETNMSTPRTNGVLIVIDSTTDTVRTKISLPMKNPQGFIKAMGTDLIVVSNDSAGCTTKIVPGATPTATCITTNTDLGGAPLAFDVSGTKIWFAYTPDFSSYYARAFDTATTAYAANMTSAGETPYDIAVCPNGKIALTDGTMNATGFRLYGSNGVELTTTALSIGIGPAFGNGLVCY